MHQHVGANGATQQSGCWGALEGMLKCGAYEQKSFWGRVGAGLGNVIKELLEAVLNERGAVSGEMWSVGSSVKVRCEGGTCLKAQV